MKDIENGAYILRAQPLHKGHLEVIKYMTTKCKKSLVVLGSANKSNDERNPLDIDLRLTMLQAALHDEGINTTGLKIITLNDWSNENDYMEAKTWGRYLYYNIANGLNCKIVTMFYSDNKNIMLNWFQDTEIQSYIDFCFIDRTKVHDGVSATGVRKAILTNDENYLRKYCPDITFDMRNKLKEILEKIPKALPKR